MSPSFGRIFTALAETDHLQDKRQVTLEDILFETHLLHGYL